jgi:hypothetical protein
VEKQQIETKKNNLKKRETHPDDLLNYDGVRFEYSKENITNVSLLCAVKILYQFYKKLPKTMEILKNHGVRLNFLLNYGELCNGYVGQDQKIDEVFTGPHMLESEKTLDGLSGIYYQPSIFLHNNFYLNVHEKLENACFPCDIVKAFSDEGTDPAPSLHRIFKLHYNNYMPQDRDISHDLTVDLNKEQIVRERKYMMQSFFQHEGCLEDFLVQDNIFKAQVCMDLPLKVYENVRAFFDYFLYSKWSECIVALRKIKKSEGYKTFQDVPFLKHLKELEEKVKRNLYCEDKNSIGQGYSIMVRY